MTSKKRLFNAQVVLLGVLAVSVFVIPFSDLLWLTYQNKMVVIFNGVLFWMSFLALIMVSAGYTRMRRTSSFTLQKMEGYRQVGLIHFFQNAKAKTADIAMILSFICLVLLSFEKAHLILSFLALALFIFSFGMHWLLNGAGYIFLHYKAGEEGATEKKQGRI